MNGGMSAFGTKRTFGDCGAISAFGGKADIAISARACPLLAQMRHQRADFVVMHKTHLHFT
jgi:hypothetical protein